MPTRTDFKAKLRAHAAKASRSKVASPAPSAAKRKGRTRKITREEGRKVAVHRDERIDLTAVLEPRSLSAVPDRGKLLCPKSVALIIFPDATKRQLKAKMKWVRENVPYKLPLGHKSPRWFEADVRWWLEDLRREGDAAGEEEDEG